jgi:hypothetical protein
MLGYGGQIIIDENKAVHARMGYWHLQCTAMCVFDDKLILGIANSPTLPSGAASGDTGFANLAYADYGTSTTIERWDGTNGEFTEKDMESELWTKNYDMDMPDVRKLVTDIVIVYRGNQSWTSNQTLKLYYRVDEGDWTTATSNDGTSSESISIPYSNSKIGRVNFPIMSEPAYNIQLKLTASGFFELVKVIFYYQIHPKKK